MLIRRTHKLSQSAKLHEKSIALANMSILHSCGGRTCYPQLFYDACDELDILLFHDLIDVAQEDHSSISFLDSYVKVRYDDRSLIYHASIMLASCYGFLAINDIFMIMKEVATIILMKKDTSIL